MLYIILLRVSTIILFLVIWCSFTEYNLLLSPNIVTQFEATRRSQVYSFCNFTDNSLFICLSEIFQGNTEKEIHRMCPKCVLQNLVDAIRSSLIRSHPENLCIFTVTTLVLLQTIWDEYYKGIRI